MSVLPKDAFTDIINFEPRFKADTINAFKFGVSSGMIRSLRPARTQLKKKLAGGQTKLLKNQRVKRFRYAVHGQKKEVPLSAMSGELRVSDWSESAGLFTKGQPKFVKAKKVKPFGLVRYYKPVMSNLGKKLFTPSVSKHHYMKKSWKTSPSGGEKRKTAPLNKKKQRHIYSRKQNGSRKLAANSRGSHIVLAPSIYELFRHKTAIGLLSFNYVRSNMTRIMEHNIKKRLDGTIRGRPKHGYK